MSFSTKQQEFIDKVLDGKSINLSGKAGTGKSFIVKRAIELLKEKGKKVIAMAPTGSILSGSLMRSLSTNHKASRSTR